MATQITTTKISATELARSLSDMLNRVSYRGEEFIVERNGQPVALLTPVRPPKGRTGRELKEQIGSMRMPGDGFADDVEAAHASQGLATAPEWPS